MFQFAAFASWSYVFTSRYPCGWVPSFGHPWISARLPAPHGFSQAATSFIACNRQGIHHIHLVTWSYNPTAYCPAEFQATYNVVRCILYYGSFFRTQCEFECNHNPFPINPLVSLINCQASSWLKRFATKLLKNKTHRVELVTIPYSFRFVI